MQHAPRHFVRIRQAVAILKERAGRGQAPVGEQALRDAVKRGEIDAFGSPHRQLVDLADVERWIERRRLHPPGPRTSTTRGTGNEAWPLSDAWLRADQRRQNRRN